jgi:hypothetical protein
MADTMSKPKVKQAHLIAYDNSGLMAGVSHCTIENKDDIHTIEEAAKVLMDGTPDFGFVKVFVGRRYLYRLDRDCF